MSRTVDQLLVKARSLAKQGQIAEAEQLYRSVIARFPNNRRALDGLASLGRPLTAPATGPSREQIDALDALEQRGQLRELLTEAAPLIEAFPRSVHILHSMGVAHYRLGDPASATRLFERVIAIEPRHGGAHVNLGNSLSDLGHRAEAVDIYRAGIAVAPTMPEAHFNLGKVLRDLGQYEAAISCFEQAIALRPNYVRAHAGLGDALFSLGRNEAAAASYGRAIAIKPDLPETQNNLGVTLRLLGRNREAIAAFDKAIELNPAHDGARARRAYLQAHHCDWDAMAADAGRIAGLGLEGSIVPPFMMLALEDDPGRHRVRAERYAASNWPAISGAVDFPRTATDRLTIGYFSADFHNHATMYLMARLFELHDRERFVIHAFSYGPDVDDAMRRRLRTSVDVFHDVRNLNDPDIAALARRVGIRVAIDLKGHTTDSRTGLFAHRAAPVQISFLGYPGTLGAAFMDYIIADPVVLPRTHRRFYSEAAIYLPHSYQVNDDSRPISDRPMTRGEMGLPDNGFVFCCFNNSFKITSGLFDIWMRLLARIEGSVLWLLRANDDAVVNLGQQAARRGIDPERLVFAERAPLDEHLARHRLADLFLDTPLVNAHTTASDALWAGLPVLTRPGEGFAARVAASLLAAIGLPELIVDTAEDYERLALLLATDRDALAKIREKLAKQRTTAPLFDSRRFTRHIEDGYRQAWDRHLAGLSPAMIDVAP